MVICPGDIYVLSIDLITRSGLHVMPLRGAAGISHPGSSRMIRAFRVTPPLITPSTVGTEGDLPLSADMMAWVKQHQAYDLKDGSSCSIDGFVSLTCAIALAGSSS